MSVTHEVTELAHDEDPTDVGEGQQQGTRRIFLARCLFFGIAYFISALVARRLGTALYGTYGVVLSQLVWLEILANAGVPAATARLLSEPDVDAGEIASSALLLLLLASTGLVAACWWSAPYIASVMHIDNGAWLWRIALLDVPFAGIYAAYEGLFLGERRFRRNAAAIRIYAVAKLCAIAVVLSLGFTIARALLASVTSTAALACILLWRYPIPWRPRRHLMRRLAALSAPIAVYLLAGQILTALDLWSLQALSSDKTEVGLYVAAGNLARGLSIIPVVQAGVLVASISWAMSRGALDLAGEHMREGSRFVLIIGAAAVVLLGIDAKALLSVLFSDQYSDGAPYLRLQLISFVLFAWVDALSHALQGAGKQRSAAVALIVTVPLAWGLNILLIPRYGAIGAAIAAVGGMSAASLAMAIEAYATFGSLINGRTILRVALASVVSALLALSIPVHGVLVLLKLSVLTGVYLSVLYFSGEITIADFQLGPHRPVVRLSAQ